MPASRHDILDSAAPNLFQYQFVDVVTLHDYNGDTNAGLTAALALTQSYGALNPDQRANDVENCVGEPSWVVLCRSERQGDSAAAAAAGSIPLA